MTTSRPQDHPALAETRFSGVALQRVRVERSVWITTLAVLLVGLLLTALGSTLLGRLEASYRTHDREQEVARIGSSLRARLADFEALARAMAGLFNASEEVSYDEWLRFSGASGLEVVLSRGATGVVYAPRVEAFERGEWQKRAELLYSQPVRISSFGSSPALPILYFAPEFSPHGLQIGRDLMEGQAERDAVMHAMSVRGPVLSAPLSLWQGADRSAGALLVVPLEEHLSRAGIETHPLSQLRGVVAVGIHYKSWIDSVLADWRDRYVVELRDPSAGANRELIPVAAGLPQVGREHLITLGGRQLTLRFFHRDEELGSLVQLTAEVAGGLLSVSLAWLCFVLLTGRSQAVHTVERMTGELAESESRFALATAATSDGIWEWRPGDRSMFLSSRGYRMVFDLPHRGPVSYREVLRQIEAGERSVVLTALRAHLKQRTPLDVEIISVDREGQRRRLRVRGQARWDGLGRVTRVAGAISDVTTLRSREDELDRVQRFYARVLEVFPHPVLIKSQDHRYIYANSAACEFIGTSREALLNGTTADLLPGQSEEHLAVDSEVLESGGVIAREYHMRGHDGREGDVVVSKASVDGADGQKVVIVVLSNVTAQRRAERALRTSLSELDGLFHNSPLGMAMVTKGGEIRRANAAFARIVGRSESELIGHYYAELTPQRFHPLDREKTIDALRRGAVTPYERAFVRPDGTEVPVVLSGALVRGQDGEPGVWTVVEDISERKSAEDALRRMNATNKSMLDAIPDVLVQFDAQLNFIAFRASEDEAMRINPGSVMGLPMQRILSPRRYAMVEPVVRKVMRERRVEVLEYSAPNANDALQHYEARVAPVSTGGVLILIKNVTEQQRRATALRESESRFRLLARAAPVIIWLGDQEFNVTYTNRRWYEMTGASERETLGRAWIQFVHPGDQEVVQRLMDEARRTRTPFETEARFRRKEGDYAVVKVTVSPNVGDHGEFLGFVCCATDMTEVHEANAELQKHRDHLTELVNQQTASMMSAKEAAERANEAKTVFLANMSHELRSPMHAVLSYARLGEDKIDKVDKVKVRDYFSRIRVSGERLLVLLNDLLDLSKLEARRMVLDLQPCLLSRICEDVAHEVEGLCAARKLTLVFDHDAEEPYIVGDPVRMAQVVRNLVSNAIKFSPDGGQITLSVSRGEMMDGKTLLGSVRLTVMDQGPGIPADELESVFDKFAQSSKTRTGAGGTGLGLAICREIVAAHGGRIHAVLREGEGAVLVMEVPEADAVVRNEKKESEGHTR